MAFAAGTAWRVRSDGASSNGGGFNTASAGTNYANQAAAQVTYTDLVIDAVTNTKITSAAFPFTALHEGNIINVTGGVGFTVQRVQIVSVALGVATCEKAVGTTGSTGGAGKLGGGLSAPSQVTALPVSGNTVYIKKATYTTAATITFAVAGGDGTPVTYIGYNSTDTDNDGPTIQSSNALASPVVSFTGFNSIVRNLVVDGNSLSNRAFDMSGQDSWCENIHTINSLLSGLRLLGGQEWAYRCKASACGGTGADNFGIGGVSGSTFIDCEATANANGFASFNAAPLFIRCLAHANVKSGFYAFGADGLSCINCVSDGNTLDGIRLTQTFPINAMVLRDNLLTNNGGYGLQSETVNYTTIAASIAASKWANNAFYNNTTGLRNQVPSGTGDITLSADPYTNRAGSDWTLNSAAGGGALLRGVATEQIGLLGSPLTGTSYLDVGAYQSSAVPAVPEPVPTALPTPPDYDDVQIPTDISRGAVGGSMKPTRFLQMPSGREQRIKLWSASRKRWSIQYEARTPDMADDLIAFWEARDGGARAFRMKDWSEYTVTDGALVPDGSPNVQLIRSYSSGSQTRTHNIFAPVSATVVVKKNGSTFAGWSVDYDTGVVTLPVVITKAITAITQAASAVVTVGAAHGFATGDLAYLSGIVGMVEANGLVGEVTATAATTITVDIDSSAFTAYISGGTAVKYLTTSDVLTWSGEHDYPVRFDSLQQQITQDDVFVRSWLSLDLIEVVG